MVQNGESLHSIVRIIMRKRHLIGAGFFVIAFLGSTLLYDPRPHPSDEALINYFNNHRSDFDRLVSMALEDSSVRAIYSESVMLDDYKVWPATTSEGFSSDRWNEYRSVFARLSKYKIDCLTKKRDRIHIIASGDSSPLPGLDTIVIVKGYVYAVEEPAPLVSSLDEMGFDSTGTFFRRIDQHWYLYHEWGISKPE